MKKIFIILPDNIPLLLCGKGYSDSLNSNGFFAEQSIISELDDEKVIQFKPDYVMFFDFGEENSELIDNIHKNNKNCIFMFYLTCLTEKKQELFIKKILNKKLKKIIFTADKDNLKLSDKIIYMPFGINAKKYKTEFNGYKNSVNIVGNPTNCKMTELFEYINQFISNISFYCDETEYIRSIESEHFLKMDEETQKAFKNAYKGSLSTEKERSKVFSESYINIVLKDKIKSGVDFSVLEVAASGGLAFCEPQEELQRLFDAGREIEIYKDYPTLIQKAIFYTNYPEIARSIGLNARRAAINNHSVYDKIREIIRITDKKFKEKEK